MKQDRLTVRLKLWSGLLMLGTAIAFGYLVSQTQPLRLIFEETGPEFIPLLEAIVSAGFCFGMLNLVLSAVRVAGMKKRLRDHHKAEFAAMELAKHDELTGLPNRRKLDESFDELMDEIDAEQCRAVLMLDMDGFKPVNDVYGHAVGDALLCALAERLQAEIRDRGLVARLGGDEFAIVSPPLNTKEEAASLARQLLDTIRTPFEINGREIRVGSGIGISLFPSDGYSASELLRRADIALYRAKTSGTSRFRFFEKEMDACILHRSLLEQHLRRAMKNNDLTPEFLPIVRLSDNKVIGFEALARWYDQEFGQVPPEQFIPIAEDAGLISDLTEAILRKAADCAGEWPTEYGLSVNISYLKLQEQSFPLRLAALLADTGVSPNRVSLDITEAALHRNIKLSYPVLRQLADSGIRLALDDYGVGSSSLNFLRDFPIDTVKIHQNYTSGIVSNEECSSMVEAIMVLAKGLKLKVIAEGVQDKAAVERLIEMGCDSAQGHYFGPHLNGHEALHLIELGGYVHRGPVALAARPAAHKSRTSKA